MDMSKSHEGLEKYLMLDSLLFDRKIRKKCVRKKCPLVRHIAVRVTCTGS